VVGVVQEGARGEGCTRAICSRMGHREILPTQPCIRRPQTAPQDRVQRCWMRQDCRKRIDRLLGQSGMKPAEPTLAAMQGVSACSKALEAPDSHATRQ